MTQINVPLFAGLSLFALIASAAAQQAGSPAQTGRDVVRPTGTAVLMGTLVTDDENPRPIRHATVSLNGGDIRTGRMTVTDDQGRFGFIELPAGHYSVSASKPAYVESYYGAKPSWQGPGSAVNVDDGQRVTIAMKMLHGSVITGTILDASGRPQPGVRVSVMQFRTVGGVRQTQPFFAGNSNGITDLQGTFRMYGLPPGDYAIAATVANGPNNDLRLVTSAEIQWAQQALQHPGQGAVGMIGGAGTAGPPPGPSVGYSAVYFPGTADASAAATVTVGPNEERSGVDFPLQWVPTARLDGTVIDGEGRPAPGVTINLLARQSMPMLGMFSGSGRSDNSGNFTLSGVTPGDYTLVARTTGRGAGPGAPPLAPAAGAPISLMWAQSPVTIDGTDIHGLTLRLQPGLTVSGRVVFEGATAPPTDLTKVRISLFPAPGPGTTTGITIGSPGGQQLVSADGTFTIGGASPGRYRINAFMPSVPTPGTRAGDPTPTWYVKSVTSNGVDTLDSGLEVSTTDVSSVVVTFTDRPTELSGALLDSSGKPAPGYWVVAFTTDRTFWGAGQGSRRLRTARPDSNGKFKIVGLPAGEYYLSALTDIQQADFADPAFLEQLAGASYKFALAEGEKKVQDLKLSGGLPH